MDVKTIWGVCTQGRYNQDQWVKTYNLLISSEGKNWELLGSDINGNSDRDSVVDYPLPSPILARYVRFQPVSWHGWISMRADVQFGDAPDHSLSVSNWQPMSDPAIADFSNWVEKEIANVKSKLGGAFSFK